VSEKYAKSGPLVSVLMCTYNRPVYVRRALESILSQTWRNIEVIIVRDGGCRTGNLRDEYGDSRIVFIDRDQNMGQARSLNEALHRATGKYVCYLGDDDIFYPNHVATLVNALEGQDEYAAAYTDLYKVHYRIMPDGGRMPLAKNVEISRDFDRLTLLQFNHVLHVSLMHRRDMLDKTGFYNDKLNVLIDFDMTRRLSFFTDFKHVHTVTGEFYAPVGDCDRKSVRKRKDVNNYIYNLLTIRSTRPPKPWPKVGDMSLILLADGPNGRLEQSLREIWSHTFYPYEIYLPLPEPDLRRLRTGVPNIVGIPVPDGSSPDRRIDEALRYCRGDYVSIVPSSYRIGCDEVAWIEKSLNPLISGRSRDEALELVNSRPDCRAVVLRRELLRHARREYGHLPVFESLPAAGIRIRRPRQDEWPFQFENLVTLGCQLEKQGDWLGAARIYEHIAGEYQNELWMQTRGANALYHAGRYDDSLNMIQNVNRQRQTPATLLIEARNHYRKERYSEAIRLYARGLEIITCGDFPQSGYSRRDYVAAYDDEKGRSLDEDEMDTIKETIIPDNGWRQHYDFVKELGDCHAAVGEYDEAQSCYDKAANLAPDEAGPYVGTGVVELQKGNLAEAETAFGVARRLDPGCSKAYCGLAMISQQRNDWQAASELYLKSLELDNNNLTALLGLFQLSCRMGTFSQVIHYLKVYLDMHPGDVSVMFCLATLYLKDGRLPEAKRLLCDVMALDPANTEAANLLEEVEHVLAQKKNQEINV